MAFSVDTNKASGSIPDGEYEVLIRAAGEATTKGGKVYFSMPLTIRNDVEQRNKNSIIWHKLWKLKEPGKDDIACGGYSYATINRISKEVGCFTNNQSFDSLEDWGEALIGKPLRVTVKNDGDFLNVTRINATKHSDIQHKRADSATADTQMGISEDDEQLPF